MDRNLGAMSIEPGNAGCAGTYYQFGRKDPYPRGTAYYLTGVNTYSTRTMSVVSKKFDYRLESVSSPITWPRSRPWLANNPYYQNYWDDPNWAIEMHRNTSNKSLFDPCPVGWSLPINNVWAGIMASMQWGNDAHSFVYYYLNGINGDVVYYPCAGYKVTGYDSHDIYSAQPFSETEGYRLELNTYGTSGTCNGYRERAFNVRCIQE